MTFEKGQSGNPSGRPKGITDKRAQLRELINTNAEQLVEKLVEKAKAGDLTALRLCVERLIPRVKPDLGICFDMPEGRIDTGDNMLAIANNITQAVASGQMTIDEASDLRGFLRQQRYLVNEAERKIKDEGWEAEHLKNHSGE